MTLSEGKYPPKGICSAESGIPIANATSLEHVFGWHLALKLTRFGCEIDLFFFFWGGGQTPTPKESLEIPSVAT